jgi:hypothetical protein
MSLLPFSALVLFSGCFLLAVGYDGIVWTKTVVGKLQQKDSNNMELPDVSETWKVYGAQQSTLRLQQPDYELAEQDEIEEEKEEKKQGDAADSEERKRKLPKGKSLAATGAAASSSFSSSNISFRNELHSFGQKTRLHMIIEDAAQLHSLNPTNPVLHSYDLVSVSATNEKFFHSCCSHESVDIVVIEAARKLPFYLKKPSIK